MFGSSNVSGSDWDDAVDAFPRRDSRGEGTDRWLRQGDPEVAFEGKEFLERQPWRVMRAQIDHQVERAQTRSRLNWTLGFSGLGLAVSMAVLLMVFASPPSATEALELNASDGIRLKGGGALVPSGPVGELPIGLTVRLGGQPVDVGAVIPPKSELVFSVDSGSYDHVLVFGVEENGTLTPYYPDESTGQSLLVGRGSGLGLPDSVVMDDALGSERFLAVFSNRPLSWARVAVAARVAFDVSGGDLRAMGGLGIAETREASTWLVKER
ncbi:MAG: hypothetical protein ACI9OJ_004365 [Myxococcota bacterium]|jgi:hypothetical protein